MRKRVTVVKDYEKYFFAHLLFNIPGVYDYELIIYHSDYKQECDELVHSALDALDVMYEQYSEYFNMAEYADVVELYFDEEEEAIVQSIYEYGDERGYESILKILNYRIQQQTYFIGEREDKFKWIKDWVELFNYCIECGLSEINDACLNLYVGDIKTFPTSFLEHILESISSKDYYYYLQEFKPFKKSLEALIRLTQREAWPQDNIQTGRFLEWVMLYKNIIDNNY